MHSNFSTAESGGLSGFQHSMHGQLHNIRLIFWVQECSADQAKKLGIDPDAAAKGKVDFVRVEAWGADGTEAELENLKMKSFSPAFSSEEGAVPFYEQLVRRLQLLESKVINTCRDGMAHFCLRRFDVILISLKGYVRVNHSSQPW